MPEQAACATHVPPWQTSGTLLVRQRRVFSSQPHAKFKSARHRGVSPVQAVALAQVPFAEQLWVLVLVAQRRSPASGSHSTHFLPEHCGVIPAQVSVV